MLSDFADAPTRTQPTDTALVELARRRVDELNARHGPDRFYFFHRTREWNAGEQRWMGRERKRGKLAEFNRLLRGATDTSYVVQHGDLSILAGVRYVITLDSDTQLPMEAGRRLVGTLSHPLNRPRFDDRLRRFTEVTRPPAANQRHVVSPPPIFCRCSRDTSASILHDGGLGLFGLFP